MNTVTADIIKQLGKYITQPEPKGEIIITSGRYYQDWVHERLKKRQQILINAFLCPIGDVGTNVERVMGQIKKEFKNLFNVQPLPFPVRAALIHETVQDLMKHFDSTVTPESVIQEFKNLGQPQAEMDGYIILTVINLPVIV